MKNYSTKRRRSLFSARAGLIALGLRIRQLKLLKPIEEKVKIKQKVVRYRPVEKFFQPKSRDLMKKLVFSAKSRGFG
jgi:hypothetical protein